MTDGFSGAESALSLLVSQSKAEHINHSDVYGFPVLTTLFGKCNVLGVLNTHLSWVYLVRRSYRVVNPLLESPSKTLTVLPLLSIFISMLLSVWSPCLGASTSQERKDEDLTAVIAEIFPKATRIEEKEKSLPVRPVYQLGELLGYAFESDDLTDLPGFAGDPIKLMIGLDTQGRYAGVSVLSHNEPVFVSGLGEGPLMAFIAQYTQRSVADRIIVGGRRRVGGVDAEGPVYFDGVTRATVSVIVINDTILTAALKVAREILEAFARSAPARPRQDHFAALTWEQLLSDGYITRWRIDRESVENELGSSLSAYSGQGFEDYQDEAFFDIYYGYLNAPIIGKNLLGESEYLRLLDALRPEEHALAVMSVGPYSAVEDNFKRGTVPSRLSVTQNALPIDIRDTDFYGYQEPSLAPGVPDFSSMHIFRIKAQAGFDPSAQWSMNLDVRFNRNHLVEDSVVFNDTYTLPDALFEAVESTEPAIDSPRPVWQLIWENRLTEFVILILGLLILTVLLSYRDWVVRRVGHIHLIRWSFLVFTLFFIGFYAQGQLSVINILTLLKAPLTEFDISVFLLDPIIFTLWIFTFISLFLWGRGIYCGWLCPFGVMQEIVGWVAKRFRIRQWRLAPGMHKSLLQLKYVILIGLVGVSLFSLGWAETLAEVEPFKTSITLFFVRSWPYVLYAIAILLVGLFVHKFFCRYICPLGAGLAVLGKLSVFKGLVRREECGSPCQLCRRRCDIEAIHKDGSIDYNECILCLECVVIINDEQQCVPEILAQKKAARVRRTVACASGSVKAAGFQ